MRLICPNCDAQYEVADNVIPEEGRDVQCSNCGSTWFQDSLSTIVAANRAEAGVSDDNPSDDLDDDEPNAADAGDEKAAKTPPKAAKNGDDEEIDEDDSEEDDEQDTEAAKEIGSTVSDEAAAILREEAVRELKARLAEGTRIESQEYLGLLEPDQGSSPKPQLVDLDPNPDPDAEFSPVEDPGISRDRETSEAVAEVVGSNRDRLPDIEEVNSSITVASARAALTADDIEEPIQGSKRRSGFRVGFVLALAIGLLALVAYVYSPKIAAMYPDTAPALSRYVEQVDRTRFWLQERVTSAMETVTSSISSDG